MDVSVNYIGDRLATVVTLIPSHYVFWCLGLSVNYIRDRLATVVTLIPSHCVFDGWSLHTPRMVSKRSVRY